MSDLKNKVEALLFASGKGLAVEDIADYCEEKPSPVKKVLTELHQEFQERKGSLVVEEHNGKWKMTVRGQYTEYIKKIVSETELPAPLLKTLAVVAYKSPVLQADIIHMRGQSAYDHIKHLVKQKFITKDEEGRSYILRITDKFFNYFDVEGDQEIRDIFAALKAKEEGKRAEIQAARDEAVQQQLGNLEVVSSSEGKDHEEIFDNTSIGPITKHKSEEEIEEEKQFLSTVDEKIEEISKRLDTHTLPSRKEEHEEEGKDQDDKSTLEEEENYL
ncbi:MAG: SMC-Scp complex subunit ScpB [Simkania sp.]|nr:SMC-Scp complex subunit ScpB [Nanoarchaeota archaeon]MCB1084245.1 SMC-Scp complex subunit ScpB [Simkania sp.]